MQPLLIDCDALQHQGFAHLAATPLVLARVLITAPYYLFLDMLTLLTPCRQGSNDKAFHCVYQMEDENGDIGVKLAKELMAVAGEALKANITRLGPLVLPVSEQLLFFFNLVARKVLSSLRCSDMVSLAMHFDLCQTQLAWFPTR